MRLLQHGGGGGIVKGDVVKGDIDWRHIVLGDIVLGHIVRRDIRRGSRIQKGGFVQEFRLENRSYPDVHDFSLRMQVIIPYH